MRSIAASIGLAAYLGFILSITLLLAFGGHPQLNLIPLKTMVGDFRVGGSEFVINFLGNIVAFMPFGILIPAAIARPLRSWQVGSFCAAISIFIEAGQYALGQRVADVDDVLLNTLGGLAGYACLLTWQRLRAWRANVGLAETISP